MARGKRKLSLDRPEPYEIKVPGHLAEHWLEWGEGIIITVEGVEDDPPVTTLTGTFDQASLHGLIRRLYAFGLPLISVVWVGYGSADNDVDRVATSDADEAEDDDRPS